MLLRFLKTSLLRKVPLGNRFSSGESDLEPIIRRCSRAMSMSKKQWRPHQGRNAFAKIPYRPPSVISGIVIASYF